MSEAPDTYSEQENTEQESEKLRKDEEKVYNAFCLDLRDAMKTPGMLKFIIHIIELTNVNGNNYTGDDHVNYMLGRESIGHDVIALLNEIDPTYYPQMLLNIAKEINNVQE